MPTPLSQNVTLLGGANITLSQSGNRVSIIGRGDEPMLDRVAPGSLDSSGYAQGVEEYYFNGVPNAAPIAFGQTTSYMVPFKVPFPISWNFIRMGVSFGALGSQTYVTGNGKTISHSWFTTYNIHIYSDGTGANSLSLQSIMSTSAGMTYRLSASCSNNPNASIHQYTWQYTYPMSTTAQAAFTTQATVSSASIAFSTNSMSNFTGPRVMDIPWSSSLPAGIYWLAFGSSSNSSSGNTNMTSMSQPPTSIHVSSQNAVSFGEVGIASNASIQFPMGLGSFTAAAGATTASVSFANISVSANAPVPIFAFHRTA